MAEEDLKEGLTATMSGTPSAIAAIFFNSKSGAQKGAGLHDVLAAAARCRA